MKVGKFMQDGSPMVGVVTDGRWIESGVFADIVDEAGDIESFMSLSGKQKKQIAKTAKKMKGSNARVHELSSAQYLAPVGEYSNLYTLRGISTIFSRAVSLKMPTQPTFDMRYTHNFAGHNTTTVLHKGGEVGGWNIELVAVIGKEARNVSKKHAYEYIGGYTIMSDSSGHDDSSPYFGDGAWQTSEEQEDITDLFYRSCFNGNTLMPVPIGPVIATSDEIDDPHDLMVRESETGRLVGVGSTEGLLMHFDETVEFISSFITLKPGDMISSSSVTYDGYKHWDSHEPGFYIDLEIEKIGRLRMNIVDERGEQHGV
ncbi:MAG: fumarylacetoacetate hydrolase family protein [Clostridia bacterium]|jgi:2-keto-4-pentenoate hydratase/2-oxohepta-3-ene-1,7-dioic acid hydratase in catechol pathway|nr:fumarylacetoacetate hydrolase family protein [Clostridia bacterium]